jgi:hypothetical protein
MPCGLRLTDHLDQPQSITRFSLQGPIARLHKPESPIKNDHEIVPEPSAPQIKASHGFQSESNPKEQTAEVTAPDIAKPEREPISQVEERDTTPYETAPREYRQRMPAGQIATKDVQLRQEAKKVENTKRAAEEPEDVTQTRIEDNLLSDDLDDEEGSTLESAAC